MQYIPVAGIPFLAQHVDGSMELRMIHPMGQLQYIYEVPSSYHALLPFPFLSLSGTNLILLTHTHTHNIPHRLSLSLIYVR